MTTTLKNRLLHALDGRLSPHAVAHLGSVYLSARSRSRCSVRYDDGQWIHRYPQGVLVNTRLGGLSPEVQDQAAQDVFLYDYQPHPGDTVVDVGAGVGGEVRLFSRLVGEHGRVVSIEAHPTTFECLRRTVELNRLRNVTPVECAVVGTAGPVYLEDDPVRHIGNGLTNDSTNGVAVAGRRLDEIMESLGIDHVDLLKMNIEGAELAVLEGSFDALKSVDHLAVSCHDFLAERAMLARASARPTHSDDESADWRGSERDWRRTFGSVTALLRDAGFTVRTRPHDSRPWVRYYVYASRPGR
ncbi:FkbM family methyltransferase [Micromonospora polyrhachis]|uniref:FkbM family methyltransferase n=1 Tax=Micromonospora polyrhachis TaxID=1282883 RepID=A0A7W7SL46_9ACTN|nr:FkbM family methyltransferase [Micromonospora polyrhachis]MBB4956739.1 FkbM family methyltransferase [Micromonospora polyrhachis]